jgi:hypothetical protein
MPSWWWCFLRLPLNPIAPPVLFPLRPERQICLCFWEGKCLFYFIKMGWKRGAREAADGCDEEEWMKGGRGGDHCRGIFEDACVLIYVLTYIYYLCWFESSIVWSFYVVYPFHIGPRMSSMLKNVVFLLYLQNAFEIISNLPSRALNFQVWILVINKHCI